MLGGQRCADFLDDVAAAIENPVGTATALLGQGVAADPAAIGRILAAIELTGRLRRVEASSRARRGRTVLRINPVLLAIAGDGFAMGGEVGTFSQEGHQVLQAGDGNDRDAIVALYFLHG